MPIGATARICRESPSRTRKIAQCSDDAAVWKSRPSAIHGPISTMKPKRHARRWTCEQKALPREHGAAGHPRLAASELSGVATCISMDEARSRRAGDGTDAPAFAAGSASKWNCILPHGPRAMAGDALPWRYRVLLVSQGFARLIAHAGEDLATGTGLCVNSSRPWRIRATVWPWPKQLKFVGGETFESHGAARVKLAVADTQLRRRIHSDSHRRSAWRHSETRPPRPLRS